jgi:hypothetical protein
MSPPLDKLRAFCLSDAPPPSLAGFDLENFAHLLLAEMLIYDEEYGVLGTLSLVDPAARREQYIASFMPEDGHLLIEEATAWEEDYTTEDDQDVAYALAVDSTDYGRYDLPEEAAVALLSLAAEHDLLPSFALLFESDEL